MKRCSTCGVAKPLEAFFRRKDATDGRQSACKECKAKARRKKAAEGTTVRCPQCGHERVLRRDYVGQLARTLCRACARKEFQKDITIERTGRAGYRVRFEVEGRGRYRHFKTHQEASRFRRALTDVVATPRGATKDPLGEAYALLRQVLAAVDAARLSSRDESAVTAPLYEAEDALAFLIRSSAMAA